MTTQAQASARRLQVLIGADAQDWSECVIEFQVGYSQRDDSGIIYTRGKLILGMPQIPPDTMNTRSKQGRQRWFKGQKIIINCTDTSRNLHRHPMGHLYILKPPSPWSPSRQAMEIEVGCELALRNFRQSDEALLTMPQGFIDRTAAIGAALGRAGVTGQWIGQVPKYQVPFQITKNGTSNIELAGKLAYGGLKYLYQNNQGQIDAIDSALTPQNPLFTLRIGEGDEIAYDPSDGGETPAELVRYTGVGLVYKYRKPENRSITYEYGPASMVNADLGTDSIITRITETIDTVEEGVVGRRVKQTVQAPKGLISAEAYPGDTGLGLDSNTETRYLYDDLSGGKLNRIEVEETRMFPAACAEAYSRLNKDDKAVFKNVDVTAKFTTTSYEYTGQDVVDSINVYTTEPIAAVVSDEDFLQPGKHVASENKTTTYEKIFLDEYRKDEVVLQPLARIKPGVQVKSKDSQKRANVKSALTTKSNTTEFSNSGQTTPPGTERRPQLWTVEEVPLQADAKFADWANINEPRMRILSLDVGCAGADQLSELAQLEGAVLIGRSLGQSIQIPFRDELFTNPKPLTQWNVYELEIAPQGIRKNLVCYQADGIQYTHDAERGILGCSGIWMAIQEGQWQPFTAVSITPPNYDPVVVEPPYRQVLVDSAGESPISSTIIQPPIAVLESSFSMGWSFSSDTVPYINPPVLECRFSMGWSFGSGQDSSDSQLALEFAISSSEEYGPINGVFSQGYGFSTVFLPTFIEGYFSQGYAMGSSLIREIDSQVYAQGYAMGSSLIREIDSQNYAQGYAMGSSLIREIDSQNYAQGYAMGSSLIREIASQEYSMGYSFSTDSQQRAFANLNFSSFGDTNGALYFIGTNEGTTSWSNPHTVGLITISASSLAAGNVAQLCDRTNNNISTTNVANSSFIIDLGPGVSLQLNRYNLQNWGATTEILRTWTISGSYDGVYWTSINSQSNNTSMTAAYQWMGVAVSTTAFYRFFRLQQTGTNSSGSNTLNLSELELFGLLQYTV